MSSPVSVSEILTVYTEQFKERVARAGWYFKGRWGKTHRTPSEWDINNGWCDHWADGAVALLGGGETVWLDDEEGDSLDHAALVFDGKYYDAQCLEGVTDYMDLPLCRGVTREQWLRHKRKQVKHAA